LLDGKKISDKADILRKDSQQEIKQTGEVSWYIWWLRKPLLETKSMHNDTTRIQHNYVLCTKHGRL